MFLTVLIVNCFFINLLKLLSIGISKEERKEVVEDPVIAAKKKAFPGLAIADSEWEPVVKETEVGW